MPQPGTWAEPYKGGDRKEGKEKSNKKK